ncbi:transposase [Variovorax ginsengisoli]|uniref:Transposase n=1 Tax=Variovorax ginsengisoli TaxID=363844 RepID=A0ABT8SEG0_9BURK|nr:transposase [Variovorax ginsengisoli]MDN8618146.1 transposase [Variovorax ginsengisoli]MDO1537316.1 transposase [Variovorax ginsengisoli]
MSAGQARLQPRRQEGHAAGQLRPAPDARGCPVALSVHEGNTADSTTFMPAAHKLREDFGIERMVMVGDRGMVSHKTIDEMREADGIGWIMALKSVSIRALVEQGHLQLGLFDERNLLELNSPDYPGERWVACRNPELAKLRARKRLELLAATEPHLETIKVRVDAGKLAGKEEIVGKVVNQYKMAKHLELAIGENAFTFARKTRHRRRGGTGRPLHHPHVGATHADGLGRPRAPLQVAGQG